MAPYAYHSQHLTRDPGHDFSGKAQKPVLSLGKPARCRPGMGACSTWLVLSSQVQVDHSSFIWEQEVSLDKQPLSLLAISNNRTKGKCCQSPHYTKWQHMHLWKPQNATSETLCGGWYFLSGQDTGPQSSRSATASPL